MKKTNIITALALTLSIGLGASAYAASTPTTSSETTTKTTANSNMKEYRDMNKMHRMGEHKDFLGLNLKDTMDSMLTTKFGITKDEIAKAKEAGKCIEDLLKEKGIAEKDFQAAMDEVRIKAIDEAVASGKITKEQAEKMKTMKPNKGFEKGKKLGDKNMFGIAGKNLVESVLTTKFNITADEIAKAKEAHKPIQDLIKEKGIAEKDFQAAVLEARNKAIDEAVASGKITKEQAEKMKANMKDRCENGGKCPEMKGKKDKMMKKDVKQNKKSTVEKKSTTTKQSTAKKA